MRVISVVSGKGGVGKTTTVVNLGIILASKFKKNVILIDCNITTPHLGLYIGMHHYSTTLNDLIKDGVNKSSDEFYTHPSGAKIIPSSLALEDLDGLDMLDLKSTIDCIKKEYTDTDIILLDCAPGFGREAIAGMSSSDEVLYVTIPYFSIVVDIVKCVHVADDLDLKSLGLLVNMTKNNKHELTQQEIENITELPVISSIPFDHDIFKSLHNRIPISIAKPHSRVSKQFDMLAAFITGEDVPKSKFIDRFFGLFDRY
ncbi:MAG: AAA family ATPase [Candidatus Aenigmarchaeota archaeon]|nr:AAA family ATPase [Candidatus Aenigmarchaeota archaeon]